MTKYYEVSFEEMTLDAAIATGTPPTGVTWDLAGVEGGTTGNYRNELAGRHGELYLEFNLPTSNGEEDRTAAFVAMESTSGAFNVPNDGTALYVAAIVRFERISGNDIWHDSSDGEESCDKLFEIYGSFRYVVHAGWNGMYDCTSISGCDHHFTFNVYLAEQNETQNVYLQFDAGTTDRTFHNVSPYSRTAPMLCNYERWYSVVLGVVPRTTNDGAVRMWVNGTKIIEATSCITADSGAQVTGLLMNGTIAQVAYDAPAHKRQFDHFIMTDSWQDIIDGGYLNDPEVSSKRTLFRK